MSKKRVLIVGAGFSGAVVARQLADLADVKSVVLDERGHIGGNCHTERDGSTGVMTHVYGPHIFHTDDEAIWRYVQQFCEMIPFINRVKAVNSGGVFSFPINLHTINQFFGGSLNPVQAFRLITDKAVRIPNPANFEEQALSMVGSEIYEAFFRGYTEKQWGCSPTLLPAHILKRIPIRFNYDDSYYSSRYQGMPKGGYTDMIGRILQHGNICVKLGTRFDHDMIEDYEHVFYTGPIDRFYGFCHGRLAYRTVYWEREEVTGDYQGNAVINYTDRSVDFTRVHEHKYFAPWESHEKSVAFREYSKETGEADIPFYPKRLDSDLVRLNRYHEEALRSRNVTFLGRLGTYRYLDMHQVISEALDRAEHWLLSRRDPFPRSIAFPKS